MKKITLSCLAIFMAILVDAQTSGGPDAYGYTWKNSNHTTNPPTYSWVDITTKGTQVTGLADDNFVGPFTVPQGFQFYWYPITQFYIGSNGFIGLNGVNMASPFPASIPLPGGGNDWIAPHMADLNFAGAGNNAECYYYATNDSLVISYINVPYWVVSPGFSGSNTFQVVISSIDNSITFNYNSMNAGTATTPIDCITGIENVTGTLGLSAAVDAVPGNNSTIKFYYPSNVTYSVVDVGVNWNNNEADGGYFIPQTTQQVSLSANIKNFGNQPVSSFSVTDSISLGQTVLSNGTASISGLAPGQDTTITFSNQFIGQFAGIYTFSSRVQGVTGDLVSVNNRKVQKIISVDVGQPNYALDYSDGAPENSLGWNGGNGGIGVYIEPPIYPVQVDSTQFHINANGTTPVGFSAMIFDDDGANNGPGTLLDSVFVSPGNVMTGTYNKVATQNNVYIDSGGVYVVWYMGGADIRISTDETKPISNRSYEILGSAWAGYRDKQNTDFLMGMIVSDAPYPGAKFYADTTNAPTIDFIDQSSNQPTQWLWDFGFNNDTSTLQNPSYTYTLNGTYNVCLTASNSAGSTMVCKDVTIRNIGLDEFTMDFTPFVYPNPAANRAFVDLPPNVSPNDVVLKVFNLVGEEMPVDVSPNGTRMELNTSNLKTGIYIFEMRHLKKDQRIGGGKFSIE